MKKERILSYKMSQKLSIEDLQDVSAAGFTSVMTQNGTYDRQRGTGDPSWDIQWDS